jgi:phosphoenolpyruvate carboxylase
LDLGRTNSLRKYTTGLLAIIGQRALLDQNPLLVRSINKNRLPYLDLLNMHRSNC